MYKAAKTFLLFTFLALKCHVGAQSAFPLSLGAFAVESDFNATNVNWLIPQGRTVIHGIPFDLKGLVELYGDGSANNGRLRVDDIPVQRSFRLLHLISATARSAPDGTTVAMIQLNYGDGSSASLAIQESKHTADYYNFRHQKEPEFLDSHTRLAWTAQAKDQAGWEKELRLFHAVLVNPSPEKQVQSLSLISTEAKASLLVAAITVGDQNAAPLADTVPYSWPLDESLTHRGKVVPIEGWVLSESGKPLRDVKVRMTGIRQLNHPDEPSFQQVDENIATITGPEGRFVLPAVSDDHLYDLIAFVEGYQPIFFERISPLRGPLQMWLSPHIQIRPKSEYYIWGKLIGPDGKPVVGATLEPAAVSLRPYGTQWGPGNGFQPRLWSGVDGQFLFERKNEFLRMCLDIRAPGLAPLRRWVPATNGLQNVHLTVGSRIVGRIIKDGSAFAGFRIGLCPRERGLETFPRRMETTVDIRGRFAFDHLPPNTDWQIYGIMNSWNSEGAIPPRPVYSGNDGETLDLGNLLIVPGLTLAGRIKSRTGETLPSGINLEVYCATNSDKQSVSVSAEGAFAFNGLSKGLAFVVLNLKGWRFSGSNRSLDLDDAGNAKLLGLIEGDKKDLSLVIEPAKQLNSIDLGENGMVYPPDSPQNRPLSGSEPAGPPVIAFNGTVIDDETGLPIPAFSMTPGRKPPAIPYATLPAKPLLRQFVELFKRKNIPFSVRIYWDYARGDNCTNGQFSISFAPLSCSPWLRCQAAHYFPIDFEPMPPGSNLIVRLKRGFGPRGVVQLPGGQPAKGATVQFAGPEEVPTVTSSGLLRTIDDKKRFQIVASDGRFEFELPSTGRIVFASHPEGWAQLNVDEFASERTIRLRPWAVITGEIVDTNGVSVAKLPLSIIADWDFKRETPDLNIEASATTDTQGRFQFFKIPPGQKLYLVRRAAISNGWSQPVQTWFVAESGKTNDLGKITLDHPPSEPIISRLKQNLGL